MVKGRSTSLICGHRKWCALMIKRYCLRRLCNIGQRSVPQTETRKAIICRQYYFVLPVCIISYITLQLLVGLKSDVCDRNAVPFKEHTKIVYFCAAFSFIISALQQTAKIAGSRMGTGTCTLILTRVPVLIRKLILILNLILSLSLIRIRVLVFILNLIYFLSLSLF